MPPTNQPRCRTGDSHYALVLGDGDALALEKQGFQPRKMASHLTDCGGFHRESKLRHNAACVKCAPRHREGSSNILKGDPEVPWACANQTGPALTSRAFLAKRKR